MTQITDEAARTYVDRHGHDCPNCGEADLQGGSFECSAGTAWQNVWCSACGAEWVDEYELVSISQDGRNSIGQTTNDALAEAAREVLANACDSGSFGPDTDDLDDDSHPRDEDGDLWYHDLWALRQALPAEPRGVNAELANPAAPITICDCDHADPEDPGQAAACNGCKVRP